MRYQRRNQLIPYQRRIQPELCAECHTMLRCDVRYRAKPEFVPGSSSRERSFITMPEAGCFKFRNQEVKAVRASKCLPPALICRTLRREDRTQLHCMSPHVRSRFLLKSLLALYSSSFWHTSFGNSPGHREPQRGSRGSGVRIHAYERRIGRNDNILCIRSQEGSW